MPCTPEAMEKAQMAAQAGSSGYHGDAAARSLLCGAAYSSPPRPRALEPEAPPAPAAAPTQGASRDRGREWEV